MDPLLLLFTTAALVAGAGYWFFCLFGAAEQKGKLAVNIAAGSISGEKVTDSYRQCSSFFLGQKQEEDKVPHFVDTFYNLVTDIYEWGWGQSFHFAPPIPGASHRTSTRLHEQSVGDLVHAVARRRVLDVGCGVGGPMRAIAANTRAEVVGITINEYQVKRARLHNKNAGLDALCEVVCGNFLSMPFPDSSFDGAYSIEATCHAPSLTEVYGEVFRVVKPGGMYVTHEWVTTAAYDAGKAEHVEIVREIVRGNALPGLVGYREVAAAARAAGFEVLVERDLAAPPAGAWWARLKMGRVAYWRNHVLVSALAAAGVAPKGTVEVHKMLFETASFLTRGGEARIFSPMYLLVCRKPLSPPSAAVETAETAAVV